MNITSSTALRTDYNAISEKARETKEPIYITKNGEGDLVVMSIDAFEAREELIRFRANIGAAERARLSGDVGFSLTDSRKSLELIYDTRS
ncbi:MAG: type II toxin-antitoxin system Phd/YefM family antitoxin [Coriobacteriia bacterium]|nr:type II toxin-antitoxin system Phd/YefM family antitoxin [Coriobacteriia bacterium]MCL2537492.1 type II toxin-antitoxin system Phd/YefM family antitoxin [Coriobacteriia bacterium]